MDGLDLSMDSLHFGGFSLKDEEIADEDIITEDELVTEPWWKQVFCCFDLQHWLGSPSGFDANFELLENDLLGGDINDVPQNESECYALARTESNTSLVL